MKNRIELLNDIYSSMNEDRRLCNSRHGELEYLTTINYIHRFLKTNANILEVGAGTGRYSIALAKEGYSVSAIELVENNLSILRKNAVYLKNINAYQGDAIDLSRFDDNSFDLTLVLGPLYHLSDYEDQQKAINEAIRVTRKNGIIFFAFLSVHGLLYSNFLQGNFETGLKENFDDSFNIKHTPQQRFICFEIDEIEKLFKSKNITHLSTVAADSIIELAEKRIDFKMTDRDFKLFYKYHLKNCERTELLGASNHILYIIEKN